MDKPNTEDLKSLLNHKFKSDIDAPDLDSSEYARWYRSDECKCCGAPLDWKERIQELQESLEDAIYYN